MGSHRPGARSDLALTGTAGSGHVGPHNGVNSNFTPTPSLERIKYLSIVSSRKMQDALGIMLSTNWWWMHKYLGRVASSSGGRFGGTVSPSTLGTMNPLDFNPCSESSVRDSDATYNNSLS